MKIALLDDDEKAAVELRSCIEKYCQEFGLTFSIEVFLNPLIFLSGFKPVYDIIFLDIEMPHVSGLEAAKIIRQTDKQAVLIFTTRLSQFAIKAFEVDAQDYILKPVEYRSFLPRMKRAVEAVKREARPHVTIPIPYGFVRLAVSDIYYIEVYGHQLSFHTACGRFETRRRIAEYEQALKEYGFLRIGRSHVVNTAHIQKLEGFDLIVNNKKFVVSRNYYRDFCNGVKKILLQGGKEDA